MPRFSPHFARYREAELAVTFTGTFDQIRHLLVKELDFHTKHERLFQKTVIYALVEDNNFTGDSPFCRVRKMDGQTHVTLKSAIESTPEGIKIRYKQNAAVENFHDGLFFAGLLEGKYQNYRERFSSKYTKNGLEVAVNENPYGIVCDLQCDDLDRICELRDMLGQAATVAATNSVDRWKQYCDVHNIECTRDIVFLHDEAFLESLGYTSEMQKMILAESQTRGDEYAELAAALQLEIIDINAGR